MYNFARICSIIIDAQSSIRRKRSRFIDYCEIFIIARRELIHQIRNAQPKRHHHRTLQREWNAPTSTLVV